MNVRNTLRVAAPKRADNFSAAGGHSRRAPRPPSFSYGIPAFRSWQPLVWYAAETHTRFKLSAWSGRAWAELEGYETSKKKNCD